MADLTFVFTPTVADAPLVINPYVSIAEAAIYFENILNTDAWDEATTTNKTKAIYMATRAIDQLNFQGRPTQQALDNGNQFPRGSGGGISDPVSPWADDTTVPQDIKDACCEEALSLLKGNDPEENLKNTKVQSEAYSSVRVNYQTDAPHPHEISGITSVRAWFLLLPYLRDKRNIQIRRT